MRKYVNFNSSNQNGIIEFIETLPKRNLKIEEKKEEKKDESWIDKDLVEVDGVEVTEGDAAVGLGVMLMIVIGSIAFCALCCDLQHKRLNRFRAKFRHKKMKIVDGHELPQESYE